MYFAIQIETGKEEYIMKLIEERCSKDLFDEVFTPKREQVRKKDGNEYIVMKSIFPGYIFVSTTNPKEFSVFLYNLPNFAKMLGRIKEEDDFGFVPLTDEDCLMIDTLCDRDVDRLLKTSFVSITEGKTVKVISGPLAKLEGQVSKVDLHKRICFVKTSFLNKEVEIEFPINFVKRVY